MTWRARIERRETDRSADRQPDHGAHADFADHQPLRHLAARAADMGHRLGAGELHGDEIDQRRPRRARGTASPIGTAPHRQATISNAAAMLAAAKKGASWPREISWTSRSGELPVSELADWSTPCVRRPAGAPKSFAYNDLGLRTFGSTRWSTPADRPKSVYARLKFGPISRFQSRRASIVEIARSPSGGRAAAPWHRCAPRSAGPMRCRRRAP